jgi:NAD(P)-dependent dehydrogenase (short-subunit alcohol dehydrogenase family)
VTANAAGRRTEPKPNWTTSVLEGRSALVTGASSGIGRAIVEEFRRAGATALGLDISNGSDLRADVSREEEVVAAFDACSRGGQLTDVVHAAAVAGRGRIRELSSAEWQRVIDVNLTGSFLVAREAARRLQAGGAITVISSQSGRRGSAGRGSYSATKFGVIGLVESLARELGPEQIRVNAVLPYAVDTPMAAETAMQAAATTGISLDQLRRMEEETIPLGRYATPEEIARVCVWLSSDLATYVTGASVSVDGAAR